MPSPPLVPAPPLSPGSTPLLTLTYPWGVRMACTLAVTSTLLYLWLSSCRAAAGRQGERDRVIGWMSRRQRAFPRCPEGFQRDRATCLLCHKQRAHCGGHSAYTCHHLWEAARSLWGTHCLHLPPYGKQRAHCKGHIALATTYGKHVPCGEHIANTCHHSWETARSSCSPP